jgi:UDP-glucose:glycoprotein glucosyltransferase
MYQEVKGHRILTVDEVKSILQNKCPHADILDILGIHSKYDGRRMVRVVVVYSKIPGTRATL